MFCPNCGNNCRDSKFCSNCGAALNCVVVQPAKPVELNNFPCDIPYGKYVACKSSLTLNKSSLVIERRPLFKKHTTTIPYSEITAVQFHRQEKIGGLIEFLTIRSEGTTELPLGDDLWTDLTTALLTVNDTLVFYHLFWVLKTLAPASASFSILAPAENELTVKINDNQYFDKLFSKYAPLRKPAVEELRMQKNLGFNDAVVLIDQAFDERQKVLYYTDPMMAVRDFNILIKSSKH